MSDSTVRCQKCGHTGVPSPTVVLDLEAEIRELKDRLATAEARVRELTAQNDAMREALTRIAQGKVDGFDLARDSVVLERCIRIARRAASETPERTETT